MDSKIASAASARLAGLGAKLAGMTLAALLLVGVGAAVLPASAAGPCQASDGLDPDRDGLDCNEEAVRIGTDPFNPDTDGDGLTDGDEWYIYGTDPLSFDHDGDQVGDGDEVLYWGTNPLVPDSFGNAGGRGSDSSPAAGCPGGAGEADFDGDRLSCSEEIYYGTDPLRYDTDGDGVDDLTDVYGQRGISLDLEQDGDGLLDIDERWVYGTNPLNPDTDGDGYGDGEEVFAGSNPLSRFCTPYGCG